MNKLSRKMDAFCEWLLRYLVEPLLKVAGISLCLVVLLQIFGRMIMDQPFRWTGEVARMIFVWFSFVGAILALARGHHLGMSLLVDVSPRRLSDALRLLAGGASALFGIIVIYGSLELMEASAGQVTTILRLPTWYVYVVFPIMGAGFIILGANQVMAILAGRSPRTEIDPETVAEETGGIE